MRVHEKLRILPEMLYCRIVVAASSVSLLGEIYISQEDLTEHSMIAHSCVHGMLTSRNSLPNHHVVLMRVTLMYVFQSCIGG